MVLDEWHATKLRIAQNQEIAFDPKEYERACFKYDEEKSDRSKRRKAKIQKRQDVAKQKLNNINPSKVVDSSDDDTPLSEARPRKRPVPGSAPHRKGVARRVEKKPVAPEDSATSGNVSGGDPAGNSEAIREPLFTAPIAQMKVPVANMGGSYGETTASPVVYNPPAAQMPQPAEKQFVTKLPVTTPKTTTSTGSVKAAGSTAKRNAPDATATQPPVGKSAGGNRESDKPQLSFSSVLSRPPIPARKSSMGAERAPAMSAGDKRPSLGGGSGAGNGGDGTLKLFRKPSQMYHAHKKGRRELPPPHSDTQDFVDPVTGKVTPAKKPLPQDRAQRFPSAFSRRSIPPREEPIAPECHQSPPRRKRKQSEASRPPVGFVPTAKKLRECRHWQKGHCFQSVENCEFAHVLKPKKAITCSWWLMPTGCRKLEGKCEFAHRDTGVYTIDQYLANLNMGPPAPPPPAPYVFSQGSVATETPFGGAVPIVVQRQPQPMPAATVGPPALPQLQTTFGGKRQPATPAYAFGGDTPAASSSPSNFSTLDSAFQAPPGRIYSPRKTVWAPEIWRKCPVVDLPDECPDFTEDEQDAHVRSLDLSTFLASGLYGHCAVTKEVLLMYPFSHKYYMKSLASWFTGGCCKVTMVSDKEHYKKTWCDWVSNRESGICVVHPEWDMGELPHLGKFLERTEIQFFTVGVTSGYNVLEAGKFLTRRQTLPHAEKEYNFHSVYRLFPRGDITLITDSVFDRHPREATQVLKKFREVEATKGRGGSTSMVATRPAVHEYLYDLLYAVRDREGGQHLDSPDQVAQWRVTDEMDKVCSHGAGLEYYYQHTIEDLENDKLYKPKIPKKGERLVYADPDNWRGDFDNDFATHPSDEGKASLMLLRWFAQYTEVRRHQHRKYYALVGEEQVRERRLVKTIAEKASYMLLMTPSMWLERMDKTLRNKEVAEMQKAKEAKDAGGRGVGNGASGPGAKDVGESGMNGADGASAAGASRPVSRGERSKVAGGDHADSAHGVGGDTSRPASRGNTN